MLPIGEWNPWVGVAAPGYFYTDDLGASRAELLVNGRSPKVILRNAVTADPVTLRYMCVKALDDATGMCVIRELPPDRSAIEHFLARLPIPVVWCGEGIAGLTQKVFNLLLKSDRHSP